MNTKDKILTVMSVTAVFCLLFFLFFIDNFFPSPDVEINTGDIQLVDADFDTSLGTNPGAPVEIIEFSDFTCPFCADASGIVEEILAEYGDNVNFVFKHFPVHQESLKAAEASECAREQEMFVEYHYMLFGGYGIDEESLILYAEKVGLDTDEFAECLESGDKEGKVQADMNEGVLNGVRGTPTFFINSKMLPGYIEYPVMKSLIEKELE